MAEQAQTERAVEERAKLVNWYRSPVEIEQMRKLYERSDAKGLAQTLGFLGLIVAIGAGALYSQWHHWPWYATIAILFAYGTVYAFTLPAVHELGHMTVFKTKALSTFFVSIFAFMAWMNHLMFDASHTRHHRSTLHAPDDLEVVLPQSFDLKGYLKTAFISPAGLVYLVKLAYRIARGRFQGDWELKLFPPDNPEKRKPVQQWAWTLLIGHSVIVIASVAVTLATHFRVNLLLIPVLITLAPFYGGWLGYWVGAPQHIGLRDDVPDFRLCCRTYIPNRFVEFIYWNMNYHIEHHMYVGVPCYNLPKLHRLIDHDLPPTSRGLIPTWRGIFAILKRQKSEPGYQYTQPLPGTAGLAGVSHAELPEPVTA